MSPESPYQRARLGQEVLSLSALCFACFLGCPVVFVYSILFCQDLLSLCLIRPLQAGCTDPVSQTQLVSWIQKGYKPPNYGSGHPVASACACCATAYDNRASFPWWYQLVQKEPLHSSLSDAIGHGPQLRGGSLHHANKSAIERHHPKAPLTGSGPQTQRLAHPPRHAHKRQEQNRCFRDAAKAQRARGKV